ncbi:MAG: aminotransferase class III-fold pyridoxal phosphate-dependent enzyme [Bacteriovoracaceae bacterium]|nr:aminotransferase class III-fold pyridoxal phosphate-dependent enzyme [Bacteriovoracaceae bacterium]
MNQTQDIIAMNKKYTYFSWMAQETANPIAVEKAKGIYFWDYEGKRYADFSSQLILTNIGHGDERVNNAIIEQMKQVHYVQPNLVTKVRGELGKALAEVTPGDLNKAFFTLGGAEAIENAMKMARMYTGKQKIITRYRSYHGGTFAAASAGGDPRRIPIEPGVGWIIHMHDPYSYRSPIYRHCSPEEGDMILCDLLEETIQLEGANTVAGVLLEGYSGSSGVIAPSTPAYWKRVREICDKYNVVLIADEVMSGFGRTGKWFGIDHYGVVPDIMTMAKGLTSGYLPLGAVSTNEKIAAYFEKNMLACGLTYNAHAVSCAAALATIKIYHEDKLIQNAADLGQKLKHKLQLMYEKHPSIGEVRGVGLHWCIELVKNRKTREEMSEWNKPMSKPMLELSSYLRSNGIAAFVRWNQVYICPPLCINEAQLDEALAIYSKAFEITDKYVLN